MLVQALAAYADTYLTRQLEDQAFEEGKVPYWVELDEQGRFLGVREKFVEQQVGKKKVSRPETMSIPKTPVSRASGSFPLLACDAMPYVLGPASGVWSQPDDIEKHTRHHAAFVELIRQVAGETNDPAMVACAAFYAKPTEVEKAREALAEKKPAPGSNVALAVASPDQSNEVRGVPFPVIQRQRVRNAWRERYTVRFAQRHAEGGEGVCLISGKKGPIATTHDKIKGLANLGGQAAGVSLMSFDKAAFRSYGWEQNANSPVSPDRATAYVLALNDLLRPGLHRQGLNREKVLRTRSDYGGMAFLHWTRNPADDDPFDAVNNPETVGESFKAIWSGDPSALKDLEANVFYLLGVSGNGGRMVVRCWHSEFLSHVAHNIRDWFDQLRIADVFNPTKVPSAPGVYNLLRAISPPRVEPDDKVNAERVLQIVRRALFGQPLSRGILAAALGRLRVESGAGRLDPNRAGLLKLCVNDIIRNERKGEGLMGETLDPNERHPAYVCGRLLAIFEGLQYQAQGEVNVTVADRYYALASTYPQLAFPKLETLSRAHLKKLRRENGAAAYAISKRIDELTDSLVPQGAKYPAQLSLEDQGRFAIGYHHQKADDSRRIAEAKTRKEAEAHSVEK